MKHRLLFTILALLISSSCFAQTDPSLVNLRDKTYVDIRTYGAKGDNVTDNFTAIQNAFNAAHTAGCDVFIPASGTFWASCTTPLLVYTGVFGDGAGSRLRITSPVGASYDGLKVMANDVYLRDFAIVDSDAPGIYAEDRSNLTIERVTIDDLTPIGYIDASANIGIFMNSCTNVTIRNCVISDVGYDAICLNGVNHAEISNNTINGFHRIGICTEADGSRKSYGGIEISNNKISGAHNSDDRAAQINSAIWCENTNGNIEISNNNITDISDNAGQTQQEPWGIVLYGHMSSESVHLVENNHIEVGSITQGIGLVINDDYSCVTTARKNVIKAARIGIQVGAGHETLKTQVILDSNTFYDFFLDVDTQGLILFSNSGAAVLDTLIIKNLVYDTSVTGSQPVINMHSGRYNYLSLDAVKCDMSFYIFPQYTATGPVSLYSATFKDCYIWSSGAQAIRAHKTTFDNCTIHSSNFQPSASANGGTAKIVKCTFTDGTIVSAVASKTTILNSSFQGAPLYFDNKAGAQFLDVAHSEFIATSTNNCIVAPLNNIDVHNHMTVSDCVFRGVPYSGVTGAYISYSNISYPYGLYYIHDNIYQNIATFTALGTGPGTTTSSDNQAFNE